MKYYVRLEGDDEAHEVIVDGERVTVDGDVVQARLQELEETPIHVLSIGTEMHRLVARRGERRGQYDLSIDGYRVAIEALDERSRMIQKLSGAAARRSGPAHIVAPMPGLIVRVSVKEGDPVRAGQGLVVMEAMKMENELRAATAGTVRRVLIAPGSAVEKGAMLLEMED